MKEEEIKTHLLNLEIFETWKNYERISYENKLENPLTYEDIRNSFKCYYYGGFYIPEKMRDARVESIILRFISREVIEEYSKSFVAPLFGFERQLRIRLTNCAAINFSRKINKVDVEIFNKIWNTTFSKDETKEILEIRELATKSLVFLSKISSFFKKYYLLLQKVREWEYEQFKKGRIY